MPTFPIQGITGGIQPRQEIDKWFHNEKNARQVALFYLALKKFQQLDPLGKDGKDPKLSYYQIAGIHGMPAQRWDGAPPPPKGEKGVQTGGYCAHRQSTFPTWHRPYLLLFEQRIWEIMKEIIGRFEAGEEELAKWRKAADTWRLPYWDWATEHVPKAVATGELNIVTPVIRAEDVIGKLDNPLHKFTNPSRVAMGHKDMGKFRICSHNDGKHGTYPWDRCISTSRWGVFSIDIDPTEQWIHGVVDNRKVDRALRNHGWYDDKEGTPSHGTIKEVVSRLFSTEWTSWEMFATTRYDETIKKPEGAEFLSLEYVHNNVHNWAGGEWMNDCNKGAGHMSDVDVSAFDPIFYLHHCNIDRLLAIWQKLFPKLWFNDRQGEDEPKPSDPLWPFHKDMNGDPWTSDACRDVTKLHYSYDDPKEPEKGGKGAEEVDLLDDLRRSINEQYATTRRRVLHDKNYTKGLKNDYIVNVVYDPFAYNGAPYTIYFFLGKPEEQGATCIGSVYNFSSSRRLQEGNCDNCQQQRANGILSRALVPITIPLLDYAQDTQFTDMDSLHLDEVSGCLERLLEWRVVIGGKRIDATKEPVPGLTVFAMKGTADHYEEDNKLSKYYDYKEIVEATKDKVNGLSDATKSPAAPPKSADGGEL